METAPARANHRVGATVWRIALIAIACVLLAEAIVRALAPQLPEPLTWYHPSAQVKVEQMEALRDAGTTFDVVFAGTSQMAYAVDPILFAERSSTHPSTYNAAVLAGYPAVNRRYLPEEIVPRLHPRTVVYGVSVEDMEAGLEAPYDQSPATARGVFGDLDRWASGHSELMNHRHDLRAIDTWALALSGGAGGGQLAFYRSSVIGPNGQWRLYDPHGCEPGGGIVPVRPAVAGAFVPDSTRTSTVWSTVDVLRAQGIRVVIAVMPFADCFFDWFNRADADAEGRRFIAAGAASRSIPVIDLAAEVHTNDLFANTGHVNASGARRYTELLVDEMDRR